MSYKFIAISGLPKSGKSTVANLLAEELNLERYSIGDYFKAQWTKDCPNREILFSEYWRNLDFDQQRQANIQAAEKILTGKYIADFRFLKDLSGKGGLSVFINAKLTTRAERAIQTGFYPGKDLAYAMSDLRKRKKDEIMIGKDLYGADYDFTKPSNYDLYLSSENFSPEELRDKILWEFL